MDGKQPSGTLDKSTNTTKESEKTCQVMNIERLREIRVETAQSNLKNYTTWF